MILKCCLTVPNYGAYDPEELCDEFELFFKRCTQEFFAKSAFCSLQNLDRSFDLCVFVCVCLSHNVSVVICMLLTFSAISFRARRRWHSANAAAEK